MDDRIMGVTLYDRDCRCIANQRVDVPVSRGRFAAKHITVDEHYLPYAFLFQQRKSLNEANDEPRTCLVNIQAKHVPLQSKASLDDVTRWRNKEVRSERNHQQHVHIVWLDQPAIEEVFQAKDCQIRNTDTVGDHSPFIIAHYFLQFKGAPFGKIEVLHFINEGALVCGHDCQNARNPLSVENEIHICTPEARNNASI